MTQLRQKTESTVTKTQYRVIAYVLTVLWLGACYLTFIHFLAANSGVVQDLKTAQIRVGQQITTWERILGAKGDLAIGGKCIMTPKCAAFYNTALTARFNMNNEAILPMLMTLAMTIAWARQPTKKVIKNPGQGKWASLEDPGIFEVSAVIPKERDGKRMLATLNNRSKLRFYTGHMIPWKNNDHEFNWSRPEIMMIRERASHENVLVTGAPGSGKTRGMFRHNIILDGHYSRTAVVLDLKWPQIDSGFADMPLYWHRLGRPVYLFAPFSKNSMRIPLLDEIENLDEALKLAKAIIAPPEYREETGEYYKSNERRALAAMILTIAQGPTPTMKELQRLGEMTIAELQTWYAAQTNPEIKNALKSMFDMDGKSIASTLSGIVNKLQIFYNPQVSRATSRGKNPAEIIDLHKLFREGGLLLIGIESKHIQGGDGEIMIQLIKRRLDRALLDVADSTKKGELPMTATYYFDELPGLGKMPYLAANLSQLRSKGACIMLGVQNNEQGSLVYTRDYWKALATNNIGTRIEFIQGMSKDDAKSLSDELGEMTVETETISNSGHRLFSSPISADARKSESVKLDKRPLMSREEILRAPRDLAVVFTKGQAPALVATPAIDQKSLTIRTLGGRYVKIKNQLYPMWERTMKGVTDIYDESQKLFKQLSAHVDDAVIEIPQDARQYFQEWLGMLLIDGCLATTQLESDKFKLRLRRSTLSERTSTERDIRYFMQEGWLGESKNGDDLTVLQEGLKIAGPILQASLMDLPIRGPALFWARQHASNVVGYPNSSVQENDKDAVGYYTQETLSIPVDVAQELYGLVPDLPRMTKGGREFVELPLGNPDLIDKALSSSSIQMDINALARSNAGKILQEQEKQRPDRNVFKTESSGKKDKKNAVSMAKKDTTTVVNTDVLNDDPFGLPHDEHDEAPQVPMSAPTNTDEESSPESNSDAWEDDPFDYAGFNEAGGNS